MVIDQLFIDVTLINDTLRQCIDLLGDIWY
jgi:hypothetical protein